MSQNKPVTLAVICLLAAAFCHAQTISKDSLTAYSNYLHQNPQEKVYIDFDRNHYNAGDTVYFKAYVVMVPRQRLSPLSAVLYLDVLQEDSTLITSQKIHLQGGLAHGSFAIPSKIPSGNMFVRAYTKWMLNEDRPVEFDRLTVTGKARKELQRKNTADPQINLMPEGGILLNSVPSVVAFKILGSDGLGLAADGRILDDQKNMIATFTCGHLGMGRFTFTPKSGHSYSAEFRFKNGSGSSLSLPPAQEGIGLRIFSNEPGKIMVDVNSSPDYFALHKDEDIKLVYQSQGIPGSFTGKLAASSVRFQLNGDYPSGVLTLTLIDGKGIPVSERLVFVKRISDFLQLDLATGKPTYHPYEMVSLDISLKSLTGTSENSGTYSVSVSRPDTSGSILSGLLLTSDLKGYIEDPGEYFRNQLFNTDVGSDLDLLMMTHGYRHYTIKEFFRSSRPVQRYLPEKGLTVGGYLRSANGKVLSSKKISLNDPAGIGAAIDTLTDNDGRFLFRNIIFNDSTAFKVITSAHNATIIPINSAVKPKIGTLPNPQWRQFLKDDTGSFLHAQDKKEYDPGTRNLREVKIIGRQKQESYKTSSLAGAGNADQVIFMKDIHGGGSVSDVLNGRLRGVNFVNGVPFLTTSLQTSIGMNAAKPMLVVIDGMMPAAEDYEVNNKTVHGVNLDVLPLRTIKTIEVLKSGNASIYGMEAGGGVLIITTVDGESTPEAAGSELIFKNMGFNISKEYYQPKFQPTQNISNYKNFLKTIYWNPEIQLHSGETLQVKFQQNGLSGPFQIKINGISPDGNIGTKTITYNVIENL